MEIISPKIMDYVEQNSAQEPELLAELRRETWQKVVNPRMLSGPLQGRLLSLISKLVQPQIILEIGTFTGYATLCLAEGLNESGKIFTIDQNEELSDIQQKYFEKSGMKEKIFPLLGNAMEIIKNMDVKFDLVFIDADKENYINYLNLVADKINEGGILLTDNVLWSGKVVGGLDEKDIDTQTIITYNQIINTDSRFETLLLPLRDGISISRKKP